MPNIENDQFKAKGGMLLGPESAPAAELNPSGGEANKLKQSQIPPSVANGSLVTSGNGLLWNGTSWEPVSLGALGRENTYTAPQRFGATGLGISVSGPISRPTAGVNYRISAAMAATHGTNGTRGDSVFSNTGNAVGATFYEAFGVNQVGANKFVDRGSIEAQGAFMEIAPYAGRTITDGEIVGGNTLKSKTANFTTYDTGVTIYGGTGSTGNIPASTTMTFVNSEEVTLSNASTNGVGLTVVIATATREITDGALVGTTLTSASAAFQAGDVGKTVAQPSNGATAGYVNIPTEVTITEYISATQVKLSAATTNGEALRLIINPVYAEQSIVGGTLTNNRYGALTVAMPFILENKAGQGGRLRGLVIQVKEQNQTRDFAYQVNRMISEGAYKADTAYMVEGTAGWEIAYGLKNTAGAIVFQVAGTGTTTCAGLQSSINGGFKYTWLAGNPNGTVNAASGSRCINTSSAVSYIKTTGTGGAPTTQGWVPELGIRTARVSYPAIGGGASAYTYTPSEALKWEKIDENNLSIEHVGPQSGKVIVKLKALIKTATAGDAQRWGLSTHGGAAAPLANSYTPDVNAQSGGYMMVSAEIEVTGLTPGETYHWDWIWTCPVTSIQQAMAVSGAQGSVSVGAPATMEVVTA